MTDIEIIDLYWNRIEDAKECVNDAYLKMWNIIPPQRPVKFIAFIGKIVRNISLNLYNKKNAKKRTCNMSAVIEELEECIPDNRHSVEKEMDSIIITGCINRYLAKKKALEADIFVRRYWYADTIPEISKSYRMTQSRITSMLYRMRLELRKELETVGVIL